MFRQPLTSSCRSMNDSLRVERQSTLMHSMYEYV